MAMRANQQRLSDFQTRLLVLFSTLLVGLALAVSARAQGQPPDAKPAMRLSSSQIQQAFQFMDRNRDGRLTRAEAGLFPRIERHFDRIDGNRDGSVSPAEFEEALQQSS